MVTAFLRHGGEILLLRRSDRVGSYPRCWAAVSGYLEEPDVLAQALREVEEETGIGRSALRLVKVGEPLLVADEAMDREWIVHPLLFDLRERPNVRLDWEHGAFQWVAPAALGGLPTVPRLVAALHACWPDSLGAGLDDHDD